MSTFIDGIGQCQVLDKSSELVDLKGHDISSLAKTGTFTWEHQANSPATLVGKILKAKKIFSKDDCEGERELYFWNKCKAPYLYVMGELLDDYTASAKECAGQMAYSRDNPDQHPLLGFSIEGSEIPNTRKGMVITRSIGRKVTLTQSPCNSMCVAEIYNSPEQKSQIADDFDSIFKSQEEAVTLFKSGEGVKIYENYLIKKEAEQPTAGGKPPKDPYAEYEGKGIRTGTNQSGKKVASHGHIGSYGFNPAEHQEQGEHHNRAVVTAENPKLGDNKSARANQHRVGTASGGRVEDRPALSLQDKDKIALEQSKQVLDKKEKYNGRHIGITKSGQEVYSHGEPEDYDFSPKEHKEAAEHHRHQAVIATSSEQVDHHIEQMKAHNRAAASSEKKMNKKECELHKGLTRDKHGKANTTGHELGVHVGTEFRDTDKIGAGHSDAGTYLRDSKSFKDPSIQSESRAMGLSAHRKVLSDLRNMPKPKLDKSEAPKWSAGKVSGNSVHFNHPEHGTVSIQKQPSGEFHVKHQGKMAGLGGVKGSFGSSAEAGGHAKKYMNAVSQKKILAPKMQNISSQGLLGKSDLKKAIEAGSYNAAPSTLTNGACYQTESMGKKQANTGAEDNQFQGTKKKDWKKRAKDDYENWPQREKFEKFMAARMPHLALGEIQAIGRTLALKKTIDLEKSLDSLVSLSKSKK